VWSPALRVGQVFEGFVNTLSKALGQPSGFAWNASDHVMIDQAAFADFVRRCLLEAAGHPILAEQIRPVLGPSVVMLDRSGAPLGGESSEELRLLRETREFAASMPS